MPQDFSRKIIQNIQPYIPGKSIAEVAEQTQRTDIIKLASNENPLGASVTWEQLKDVFADINLYPHQAASPLVLKLCQHWNITPQEIILGNGSDEIIQLLTQAYLNAGDNIITSMHTFSVYEATAQIMDAEIRTLPMRNYTIDLDAMLTVLTDRTKLIFIANPNNPTGTIITHQALVDFLEKMPKNILIILDEAYADYATHPDFPRTVELMKTYTNLVVLRTFSKLYGLAGLRIGYGVAHPSVIAVLQKIRPPFNVNSLALVAGALALENYGHVAQSKALNESGKQFLYDELDRLNLIYLKTEANFVCIFLPILGKEAMHALLQEGIIIRPLESFNMPHAIRVTIGLSEQNLRFITTLKKVLNR